MTILCKDTSEPIEKYCDREFINKLINSLLHIIPTKTRSEIIHELLVRRNNNS